VIVAGVMSGTSADGINVALVRVSAALGRPGAFRLLAHAEYRYPAAVRRAVLAAMNARIAAVADLARLNFLLGELYADAVLATQKRYALRAELIGCHGQTLYHQGESQRFLGRKLAVTWQTGEGAVIAARTGLPVVSDFRPADMAAGGKGAPLVPFLDYQLYRDARVGRIVQNIGGIANLTAIPAGARLADVVAFDTGPGNMVIDALAETLYGVRYDRNGRLAAQGKVQEGVVKRLLRAAFFRQAPPKTAGREQFGREYAKHLRAGCLPARKPDILATATALTARSITDAIRRFLLQPGQPYQGRRYEEMIVSGGGVRNATLMQMLTAELVPLGIRLRSSAEFGLPPAAKEAAAFAVLAFQTWLRKPSNVPTATGAERATVLGKFSYP
jgi:anhydro-N-acetylmuramic acid kinase